MGDGARLQSERLIGKRLFARDQGLLQSPKQLVHEAAQVDNIQAEQQQLSRFFCDNSLTASQQEFLREIVEYVRANGDVTRADLVQASPFTQIDFDTIFIGDLRILTDLVDTLHNPVTPSPAA